MITATGWTLEEFDRQPFPFVLELIEHWYSKDRRPRVKGEYDNASAARSAGVLPTMANTVTNERALPQWARDARQQLRADKAAAAKSK